MNVGEMLSRCTPGAPGIMSGGALIQCRDLMAAMGRIQNRDAMAALGLAPCSEWAILLVRMKYMGEDQRRRYVTLMVMSELTKIAVERQWPRSIDTEQPLTKLANLAIAEYLLGECCPTCNGQKQVGPIICQDCDGTGLPISDDARRGVAAGFHPLRWRNVWSDKYPYAQAIVRNADELVLSRVAVALGLFQEAG